MRLDVDGILFFRVFVVAGLVKVLNADGNRAQEVRRPNLPNFNYVRQSKTYVAMELNQLLGRELVPGGNPSNTVVSLLADLLVDCDFVVNQVFDCFVEFTLNHLFGGLTRNVLDLNHHQFVVGLLIQPLQSRHDVLHLYAFRGVLVVLNFVNFIVGFALALGLQIIVIVFQGFNVVLVKVLGVDILAGFWVVKSTDLVESILVE